MHLVTTVMRAFSIVSLGATFVGTALAQTTFEPVDFNATEALLQNGIDASLLANLEDSLGGPLSRRTSPCSLAVRRARLRHSVWMFLTLYTSVRH